MYPDSVKLINPTLTLDWLISNSTGKGVQVAVIDSGVDASHPALKGKIKRACVVTKDKAYRIRCEEIPAEQSFDNVGHGTGVAGIITEIASDAEIISIKVLNEYNSCTGDILIEGISWALNQNIKLINMSLALSKECYFPAVFKLCEQACVQDAIIISARRNFGGIGCPAMFSSVISVDRQDFGSKYDIRYKPRSIVQYDARGTRVKVPTLGGKYAELTGTSFATPHVTGIIALVLQVIPNLIPVEAKAFLKSVSIT